MSEQQDLLTGWDEITEVSRLSRTTILRRVNDSDFPIWNLHGRVESSREAIDKWRDRTRKRLGAEDESVSK